MPAMDHIPAEPSEVQVTRPTLTVPRRSKMYDYCPEERPGLRERLKKRARTFGGVSRGGVWGKVKRRLPILEWLPKYNPREALLGDLIAGIIVGVMSLPQGMGYALMADLPPITGLYASIFSSLVYMLLGTSHHVSLGLVASLCMLTGKVVGDLATLEPRASTANATDFPFTAATQSTEDLYTATAFTDYADLNSTATSTYTPTQVAAALTIVVGVWQVLMAVFQLGEVFTVLLSEMVISGFTTGVAFHVLTSQAKNMLGIPVPRYSGPFKAFYTYRDLFGNLFNANPAVLVVSSICLVVLVVNNEVLKPKVRKVSRIPFPMELVVVAIGTLTSYLLDMNNKNNVDVIGHVPKGFPVPSMPLLELFPQMFVDSVLMGIIGYTLAISMTKILAKKRGYTVEPTQEMYAQGFTNVIGSFFNCAPMSVSLSRSLVQEAAGGVTNITSLFTSCFLIAVLYSIGPLFESLPTCVLSSIIVVALKGLFLQVHDLSRLWSSSRPDAVIWLVSCIVSMVVDLDYGLLAGVVTSLLVLLFRAQKPTTASLGHVPSTDLYLDKDRYQKAVEVPGVKIFQFGGPLHFGNAPYFRSSLFSATGLDLDALKAAHASSHTKEEPTADAPLPKVEKEMVVVVIGPEFNTSSSSLSDKPKDNDNQDNDTMYGSNEDMSEDDSNRDDRSHNDVNRHDNSSDNAVQNDKNETYSYLDNQGATSQNLITQDNTNSHDSDDDDDASDSGVSQATTQEASSASPSTPRITERTLGIMHDDAASTTSSTPTLTDKDTVTDTVSTFPSTRTQNTEQTVVVLHHSINTIHSIAAKEPTIIMPPESLWLVVDLGLVSFVDSAGAAVLKQLHRDLQPAKVTMCLAAASDRVLQALDKCGVLQEVGSDLTFHSVHDAVTTITCARTRQAKNDSQEP